MTPLTAVRTLDRHFLDVRCRIIEIAATLDRVERGEGAAAALADPRVRQIRDALGVLTDAPADRAARCQQVFSRPYDEGWQPPNAR